MKKKLIIIAVCMASLIILAAILLLVFPTIYTDLFGPDYNKYKVLHISSYQVIDLKMQDFADTTYIITSSNDEIEQEKKYGINIKDGNDYRTNSLVLSVNYEIDQLDMYINLNPDVYKKDSDNAKNIRLCKCDTGKYQENKIFIYSVKEKNIVSEDEYEDTFS